MKQKQKKVFLKRVKNPVTVVQGQRTLYVSSAPYPTRGVIEQRTADYFKLKEELLCKS